MKISIAAIGRLKNGPENELFARYLKRASATGRAIGISAIDVKEFGEAVHNNSEFRKRAEAENLLNVVSPRSYLIAMDENGRDLNSMEFSNLLRDIRDRGEPHLVFAIGGADGHAASLLSSASNTLRLGKLTWPHQIARLLLMEQIYRAMTLLSGHPYHRH